MSLTLPTRVAELRDKLGRLQALSSKQAEASELAGLRTDLAAPAQSLGSLSARRRLLEQASVPVSSPDSLGRLRRRASTVREKFKADRTATTLKKGQGWRLMVDEAAVAIVDIDKALHDAWRDYRATLFSGEAPGKIRSVLAGTKENTDALEAYRVTHEKFMQHFQSLPTEPAAIERARALAAELVRIAERFDYNVNPDVKSFLAAVQAGGAPLAMLTDDVLAWLKDGNGMNGYRIRAVDTQ